MGELHAIDWAILFVYFVVVVLVGTRYARRAGEDIDSFFLTGRSLPWWLAGTSMVATSFSADTPLVISGWVREYGIWKNWAWWCYALAGCLHVFLFARWWRRADVMTKAELVELRYGGRQSRALRGVLGALHALVMNTMIMAWVLLAAEKISTGLFGLDPVLGLTIACVLAIGYSISAGLWGVVMTDMAQFSMAMIGAAVLAFMAWEHVGGGAAALAAVEAGTLPAERLALFPPSGPGGLLDASFWTVSLAAACVYLGVGWWASENVDGAAASVQRIAASRNEREGLLAVLWFDVAHYALRPWFWIVVGLASLFVLPTIEVHATEAGVVQAVSDEGSIVLQHPGGRTTTLDLHAEPASEGWAPEPRVAAGAEVAAGELVASTDPEKAYVVMLRRYLPVGLLGLAAAALVAAFMSTIDTHSNLAASYFVNDVYRRFLRADGSNAHYVLVSRVASVAALAIAAVIARMNDSIGDLFLFFMYLLSGVGPVYLLRWVWWRVRASTELTAMLGSVLATIALTRDGWWLPGGIPWPDGPLTPDGTLAPEGRVLLVVLFSLSCALVSMAVTRAPDPASLVEFYRRVRPVGAWGPVRALCPDVVPRRRELGVCLVGSAGAAALVFGLMLAPAYWLFERPTGLVASLACALAGGLVVAWALRLLVPAGSFPAEDA